MSGWNVGPVVYTGEVGDMGETNNWKVLVYSSIGSFRELLDTPSFVFIYLFIYFSLFSAVCNKPVNAIEDFKANANLPTKMPVLRVFPNQWTFLCSE